MEKVITPREGGPSYRKLIVWQKAHKNALRILEVTSKISFQYSRIMIQCVSSATSIGANIAEGNAAGSSLKKKQYFEIALNSSYEFDNWIQILKDSKVFKMDPESLLEVEQENIEVIKILTRLKSSLNS